MNGLIFVVASAVFALALTLAILAIYLRKKRSFRSLNLRLLLITLPKISEDEGKEPKDPKNEINLSEQLFSALTSINQPFVFEAAVHNVGELIHFYLAAPEKSLNFAMGQIQGLWPNAQVNRVDDFNIFNANGSSVGAYLTLKQNFALPIRTYQEANVDTFAPVISHLSQLKEIGEGAALQVVVAPAKEWAKKSVLSALTELKKGKKLKDILQSKLITFKDITSALSSEKKSEEKGPKIIDEEAVKAFGQKVAKPLFSVNVRLIASAAAQFEAESILESLAGAFAQFSAPLRNEIKIVKPRNLKKLFFNYSFREPDANAMILNSEELAGLFHLPISGSTIPRVKWLRTKEAPPPQELSAEGSILGESVFRGEKRVIRLSDNDRRRHLYVIGQTGVGKSVMIENLAIEDIKRGKGICFIDPHGDAIEKILSVIPKERVDDVVVFDPGDIWRPLGLNMLEYDFDKPEQKTFVINEMVGIFDRLYDLKATGGPMFEQYLRGALLLLMEDAPNEPATLVEVPRVFFDADFRNRKLARIKNPVVVDFWEKEATKTGGEAALQNMTPYITSKFNTFIANDYVRPIIGQTKSAFNFRQIMDEGKIFLVNLSKGRIGDLNANLLGMIIVGKLLMAALSRVDIEQEKRRDFSLFMDEFQNISTDSIATILSEARKYRLNLVIAHQFIAQLAEKIRDAVFGNVGSMAAFRVGAEDADFLVKYFAPVFTRSDFVNIENFNAYAKILVNNQPAAPFNIHTFPPQAGSAELRDKLKELSRLMYGRDRQDVEDEILIRLRA
ncbi:MAG: TraM recognition domain-containing protein [Parcubacteria group bacterium]|nr:TraM recognition domain-containing protein [Parcubacteria group bacterium]